jgi:hypothetical protein
MALGKWRIGTGVRFLLLYVGLIAAFAVLYVLIKDDFCHTTVRLEPSYRVERRALGKALESAMQDSTRFMSITLPSGNVRVCGAMWFDDLGISSDGRLRFTVQARVLHLAPPIVYREDAVFEVKLPVDFPPDRPGDLKRLGGDYYTEEHQLPMWVSRLSGPPVPERVVASLLAGRSHGGEVSGVTYVPEPLYARMVAFRKATEGNPSDIPGSLGRMLYLSIVTMNTLGYGDILPLTARARMCTELESLMGIVVLGLFVSSVTGGRAGSRD